MNDQDDIILDNKDGIDDSVVAEEHLGDSVKKLKEKLKEAEAKAKEHLDNWQRAQAEFVNLRKRDEEAKADFIKFANTSLIEELLPVLDGLSLAVAHGDKGVEQIYSMFLKILKQKGLEELDPIGELFDPSKHEAIGMVATDDAAKDHTVLDVLQKGYVLNGKVVRPAKVRIGEYKA